MESGRWIDGRYEPFGSLLDRVPGAPTAEELAADTTPAQAAPAGVDDALDSGSPSHDLVPAAAATAGDPPAEDDLEPAASRPSDAFLRLTAAVMLPLSVVAVATATTVLVGEDRTAPLSAEAAPGALDWSPGPDGLPALPDFTPRGLPTLPFEPVPSGRPAADAATQPERATPRDAPAARTTAGTTARTTAGARRIPDPAVVDAPRRPAPGPASATTQPPPPPSNNQVTPTRPPSAAGQGASAAPQADPSAFDVPDTPTVPQEPAPQTGGGGTGGTGGTGGGDTGTGGAGTGGGTGTGGTDTGGTDTGGTDTGGTDTGGTDTGGTNTGGTNTGGIDMGGTGTTTDGVTQPVG